MKVLAWMLIAVALAGCGKDDVPPPQPPPTSPAEAEVACPVEGTRFRLSRGIDVTIGTATVKVCSQGCAIRAAASPDRYVNKAK